MNKFDFTLFELLNVLHASEGIIKCHPSVNNVKKLHLKKKVPSNPNMILNPNGDIGKGKKMNNPKLKGKCYHCGVEGH